MMKTADSAVQNAITAARRSERQTGLLWALVQAEVRSTTRRRPAVMVRPWLAPV